MNSLAAFDDGLAINDPRRSILKAGQLAANISLAPMAVSGQIFNAVVVIAFSHGNVPNVILAPWISVVCGISFLRLRTWRRYTRDAGKTECDELLKEVTSTALLAGVAWGVAVAFLLKFLPNDLFIPGIVTAGMMHAGASTLNATPKAALAFVGPIAVGALLGLCSLDLRSGLTALALLLSYCLVLARNVDLSFSQFAARTLHEHELVEQADTVKLLLHDYQAHSSDWLWLIDQSGNIAEVSQRFSDAAHRPVAELAGLHLLKLFDEGPEAQILEHKIKALQSFSDITIPLSINGERHWWTLSADRRLAPDRKTVIGLRGVASDVTATRRAEAKVAYMAHYDGLTDLANRSLFNETLQRALHRNKAEQPIAIFCLDLDQFKSVNDTLGHPIGDELLRIVARRLDRCIGDNDLAARLGGDEFAVLQCTPRSLDEVGALAERILSAIGEPIEIDGHCILSSASIGIALAPHNGDSVSELMRSADLALYDAKANGRNKFSFFEASMDDAARERRAIEMDLREALINDQLSMYYQPLIDIKTGSVCGCEALMRWRHPERGMVSPDAFIPIAEETGLINQLGEWALRQAISEVANWPEPMHVAVNLSASQIRSPSLIPTIVNSLSTAKISALRLELEITESVLMQDSEANLAILHQLRELGVRIALDDFGTGYSSLNYLRSFPFDKIKIDRCFIQSIDTNEESRAIVASVAGMAKRLGMRTTAEGVERMEQLTELLDGDCTEIQGYLFSEAVSAEELVKLRWSFPHFPRARNAILEDAPKAEELAASRRRSGT